jgi:hypothetical protein
VGAVATLEGLNVRRSLRLAFVVLLLASAAEAAPGGEPIQKKSVASEGKKRGFRAELTEIPNHDHNYYSRSAEINEKAWDFLKAQALAAEPKYKEHQFR